MNFAETKFCLRFKRFSIDWWNKILGRFLGGGRGVCVSLREKLPIYECVCVCVCVFVCLHHSKVIQQVFCRVLRTRICLPSPILVRDEIVWRINPISMIRTKCAYLHICTWARLMNPSIKIKCSWFMVPYSMVYLVNSLYYGLHKYEKHNCTRKT